MFLSGIGLLSLNISFFKAFLISFFKFSISLITILGVLTLSLLMSFLLLLSLPSSGISSFSFLLKISFGLSGKA